MNLPLVSGMHREMLRRPLSGQKGRAIDQREEMSFPENRLLISADANADIGLGHLMRCLSIADAAVGGGMNVTFVVSNEYALTFVRVRGYDAVVVERSERCYVVDDAALIAGVACERGASCLLVDSYAVDDAFFAGIRASVPFLRMFYVDDGFTFAEGLQKQPHRWDVDGIIDYGFDSSLERYEAVYGSSATKLMVSPRFAPVRNVFHGIDYEVRDDVREVLVTTGSTNPNHALERMCAAAAMALPACRIGVVVGPKTDIDLVDHDSRFDLLRGIEDLSSLMEKCDLAISAGGSTLYELACVGVPTIALPIVENQFANVRGFRALNLGSAVEEWDVSFPALVNAIADLAFDRATRRSFSLNMRTLMSEDGAAAIIAGIRADVAASGAVSAHFGVLV